MTNSDDATDSARPATRVTRSRNGRVLGGVCAGMPAFWGLGTNGFRLLFLITGLCGGVGVIVYLACWLVIPAADETPDADRVRNVVLLAWAACVLVALALLAAIGAVATVFGLGWVIVALVALLTLAAIAGPSRIPKVAVLSSILALTLPAVAVALSPMRLTLQPGDSYVSPSLTAIGKSDFRSGFGTMVIDLRHTQLPSSGVVPLEIHAGLRRTIVALPTGRCVNVVVHYDVHTFTGQLAALLTGRNSPPFPDLVLFGRLYGGDFVNNPHGIAIHGSADGPTLDVNFSSQGGSLYVRDYPQNVIPSDEPNWPGFVVHPEPRPDLQDEPQKGREDDDPRLEGQATPRARQSGLHQLPDRRTMRLMKSLRPAGMIPQHDTVAKPDRQQLIFGAAGLALAAALAVALAPGAPALVVVLLALTGTGVASAQIAPVAGRLLWRRRSLAIIGVIALLAVLWVVAGLMSASGRWAPYLPRLGPGIPFPFVRFGTHYEFRSTSWPWRVDGLPLLPLLIAVLSAGAGLVLVTDAVRVQIGLAGPPRSLWRSLTQTPTRGGRTIARALPGVALIGFATFLGMSLTRSLHRRPGGRTARDLGDARGR